MADYNSVYTGVQVDEAVAKTAEILNFVQVYGGSPTITGIPMSSISINPDTGDKTGTYDIIYSDTSDSMTSSSGRPNLSRIWIGEEGQYCGGSGHSNMNDTSQWASSCYYDANTFNAYLYSHSFGSGVSTQDPIYIHKIFRLQTSTV